MRHDLNLGPEWRSRVAAIFGDERVSHPVNDHPIPCLDCKAARAGGERAEVDMSPEAVAERAEAKRRHAEAVAYVASYTGTWGLPLDIRANPRWGTKYLKLSERQVDALLKGRDRDRERSEASLEMARINTELANDDEYQQWLEEQRRANTTPRSSDPEDRPVASPGAPRPAVGGKVTPGMYRLPDGQIVKVQPARQSRQLYAKRLVRGGRRDGDAGPDLASGTFVYERGLISRVRPEHRMTLDEAAAFGRATGVCCVCGALLTDPKSIAAGIGPICASRV